ncbi:MAG: hypothetical protein ACRDPM_02480, partial [Solirubrobacteraceae bacterium]
MTESARGVTERIGELHPDHVEVVVNGNGSKRQPTARNAVLPYSAGTMTVRGVLDSYFRARSELCLDARGRRPNRLEAETVVFDGRGSITPDQCPPTLGALIGHQTDWNQALLHTLSADDSRQSPFQHRAAGVCILAMSCVMALAWLTIPVAILTAVAAKAPVTIALCSLLPAVAILAILAVEVAGLVWFCRAHCDRASARDYGRLVLGLPLYEGLLAVGATRAVARVGRASLKLNNLRRAVALVVGFGLLVSTAVAVAVIDAALLAHVLAVEVVPTMGGRVLALVGVSLIVA